MHISAGFITKLIKDGEHNFQSEGDRYKENITFSLHYMVSMCKGRRESLVNVNGQCSEDG